jgi:alpha-tubulin suppressor-like RCC1 family protein
LILGTTASSNVPVAAIGMTSVAALAAGQAHTCAVLWDGTAYCWGANNCGQLGNGARLNTPNSTPSQVSGFTGMPIGTLQVMTAGNFFTCVRMQVGCTVFRLICLVYTYL